MSEQINTHHKNVVVLEPRIELVTSSKYMHDFENALRYSWTERRSHPYIDYNSSKPTPDYYSQAAIGMNENKDKEMYIQGGVGLTTLIQGQALSGCGKCKNRLQVDSEAVIWRLSNVIPILGENYTAALVPSDNLVMDHQVISILAHVNRVHSNELYCGQTLREISNLVREYRQLRDGHGDRIIDEYGYYSPSNPVSPFTLFLAKFRTKKTEVSESEKLEDRIRNFDARVRRAVRRYQIGEERIEPSNMNTSAGMPANIRFFEKFELREFIHEFFEHQPRSAIWPDAPAGAFPYDSLDKDIKPNGMTYLVLFKQPVPDDERSKILESLAKS